MNQHPKSVATQCACAVTVFLISSTTGWAADPLVPTTERPWELLQQYAKEPGRRVGIFDVHLNLRTGVTHDDNIQLTATNRQADFITTLAAELLAVAGRQEDGLGTSVSLAYKPTLNLFANYSDNNALDHHVKASGQWAGPKLTLGLSQEFEQVSDAVIEVGQRLQQRYYRTDLMSKYALSEKTSIEVNPRLTISEGESLLGSWEWAVDSFFNWQVTPKVVVGVGGSLGYLDIEDNPFETYERALLRVSYTATDKLDISAIVGGEWWQFDSGQAPDFVPVFGLSGVYRPFRQTTLTLEGHRRVQPSSILSGQSFTATGISVSIRQWMWETYFVGVGGSFENRNYQATEPGVAATRQDDYVMVRAEAGAQFLHKWTIRIFYEYQEDLSNEQTQSFTDNQVGLEATWGF